LGVIIWRVRGIEFNFGVPLASDLLIQAIDEMPF
jgi:hypothetical protein